MFGIDISHHNYVSDYASAKNAVDFAYIKATEGPAGPNAFVDSRLGDNIAGFTGKPRGLYHYTDLGNVASEVGNFVTQWRRYPVELDPVLDAECPGIGSGYIAAWRDEFRRQTGHRGLGVYTSKSLFSGACEPTEYADADVWLWAARYYENAPDFSTLGWDHPALKIYQYWDKGSVPGIEGWVDLDVARSIPWAQKQAPSTGKNGDDVAAGTFAPTLAGQVAQFEVLPVPEVGVHCTAARLTLASGWGDTGTVSVWAIRGPEQYLQSWTGFGVGKDNPWVVDLPHGTMQVSIEYTSQHPLGWLLDVDK